jgi:ATP-dependent Clp protease protease subunit
MKFNKEDKGIPVEQRKPITLLISSGGGDVVFGLGVIDVIKNSKTPVHGIVLTVAYSMAFLIYAVCHKRYMLPSSSLLIHDGSMAMMGTANKVKDLQSFYNKLDSKLKEIVINHSNITNREYERNKDRELYLFPEESKKKNLCDGIIYVDVDVDDIF